jgi:shikimate kinase
MTAERADGDESRVRLPVILIGPVNAGKSTLAALLAKRLGATTVSLDEVCSQYFEEAGYDESVAREHFQRGGQAGALEYVIQFYPAAVERILAEYPRSVIELGAGHTVYEDPDPLARVKRALAPYPNVVLLLPSSDPDESLRILGARESNPYPEILAMNERFVRHRSNYELARITVYTESKTTDQTCSEVISRLS